MVANATTWAFGMRRRGGKGSEGRVTRERGLTQPGDLPWAGTGCHVQQIISHAMVLIRVVEGMMVDHTDFIVVLSVDRKSVPVAIELVGWEREEGSVLVHIGHGTEQRPAG